MSKQLDWLAEKVLDTFTELGFDQPYINENRRALTGKDRFTVLVWLNNLDADCKEDLARRLGIALSDLDITIWEHVSISTQTRCPTWEEMCFVKDLFWDEEDCVVQYHPPKSDYINCHPRCLHLWRPIGLEIPRPPKILVGI